VIYEGRLGERGRRVDLLFVNSETVVVELKILRQGLSLDAIINNGAIQAYDYAQRIEASSVYLFVCSNYDCELKSPINVFRKREKKNKLHDSDYVKYDDQEDSDYNPDNDNMAMTDDETSSEQAVLQPITTQKPLKLILFKYSEDWRTFLSSCETDIQIFEEK